MTLIPVEADKSLNSRPDRSTQQVLGHTAKLYLKQTKRKKENNFSVFNNPQNIEQLNIISGCYNNFSSAVWDK